jgi:hypothetical protein
MTNALRNRHGMVVAAMAWLVVGLAYAEEVFDVAIDNPSFADGVASNGAPKGWSKYGSRKLELKIVDRCGGGKALLIADDDPTAELGVVQAFPLKGGVTYQATVKVEAVDGKTTEGAQLQLRFLPSNKFVQKPLTARSTRELSEVSLLATAPPGTVKGMLYLYTHRGAALLRLRHLRRRHQSRFRPSMRSSRTSI